MVIHTSSLTPFEMGAGFQVVSLTVYLFSFETRSCCVAQAGFELSIPLPLPREHWDYKCVLPYSALNLYLLEVIFHSSRLSCVFPKDWFPDGRLSCDCRRACRSFIPFRLRCSQDRHTCSIPSGWRPCLSAARSQYKGLSGLQQMLPFLCLYHPAP